MISFDLELGQSESALSKGNKALNDQFPEEYIHSILNF